MHKHQKWRQGVKFSTFKEVHNSPQIPPILIMSFSQHALTTCSLHVAAALGTIQVITTRV